MEQRVGDLKNYLQIKVSWVLEIQPLSKTGLTNTGAHVENVSRVC